MARDSLVCLFFFFFFFNDTATTEIYTLSLHDALPISRFIFSEDRRLEHEPSGYGRACRRCLAYGIVRAPTRSRTTPSLRSWQSVRLRSSPPNPGCQSHSDQYEPYGQLLRQCRDGELFQYVEMRVG